MKAWLRDPYVGAAALVSVGFLVVAYLGVRASGEQPPDAMESVLLVVLSGMFQLLGILRFHRIGKADPSLARTAVRKLAATARQAVAAGQIAQEAYERGDPEGLRLTMGQLSVHLAYLAEANVIAIGEWKEFHADALSDLEEESGSERQD